MRALWAVGMLVCLPAFAQPRGEPRAISIHPFTGQRGTTFIATIRGSALGGARSVTVGKAPFTVTVEGAEQEAQVESSGRNRGRMDLVKLRVDVAADATPG